jgi:hypothetical protein
MPKASKPNSLPTSASQGRVKITRTVSYSKLVVVNDWTYPDKSIDDVRQFEESRHGDGLIAEIRDDLEFVSVIDIKTEVTNADS